MEATKKALGLVIRNLSDQNYEQSLPLCHLRFDIGQTYHQIPPDLVFDAIWNNRAASSIDHGWTSKLIHPAAHLIVRFANDAESDHILASYSSGLQSRLCARSLREFFSGDLAVVWSHAVKGHQIDVASFYADTNLIAHWANLGYVEEAAIRNHILQSLIPHPTLYDHQAGALVILFKLAGATFGAYADPSVVDRCFKLLRDHYGRYPEGGFDPYSNKRGVVKVRAPPLRVRGSSG